MKIASQYIPQKSMVEYLKITAASRRWLNLRSTSLNATDEAVKAVDRSTAESCIHAVLRVTFATPLLAMPPLVYVSVRDAAARDVRDVWRGRRSQAKQWAVRMLFTYGT
ncbi:hypothetical protein Salat_1182500 [Sesamum alatum]|uniref:Uncharacterized protein n=1 Tax=Sesamum alatum TaxID=300844 RepID=A0AAE2CNN2_9LAMI|nr:hypothetical protein Salat_1182500 [Sesamum alatum]